MNFPGGSICSLNRHKFSRRAYRKDMFFKEGGSVFVEQTLISHQTDTDISRNPYLVLEHIQIFQEPLFSNQTDVYSFSKKPYLVLEHLRFSRRIYLVLEYMQFSRRPLCLEHIGIFQENTASRTDFFNE